ncbi:hypothetical protein BVRB_7g157850 [Beta vulgaris subsp. vulgaris]|nr:hypothetical protein BVRB_7g157850 [Beta vulgaris subsp. vulgaris]
MICLNKISPFYIRNQPVEHKVQVDLLLLKKTGFWY